MSPVRQRTRSKLKSLPFWVWPLYFLLLFQILLSAQNPGLMSDDSGEMIAASFRLGMPHPPGYPLFCLLGRLLSFLPIGTLAFRFNLFSGVVAFLCLAIVADTCRKLTALEKEFFSTRPLFMEMLLAFVLGSLFFNRSFFAQAMTAKGLVYMLSLLVISTLIWLRTQWELSRGGDALGKGYFVFFLFVVGFGNHWQTQILLIPFMLIWALRDAKPLSFKTVTVHLSFGFIALSSYLYLPLRSALNVLPNWGAPSKLSRFLWVVTRKLSSGTEAPVRNLDHYLTWGSEYLRLMSDYWWPGFWLVGLTGFLYLGVKNQKLFFSFLVLYLSVLYALLTVARDEVLFLLNAYLISIHGLFVIFGFFGLTFLFSGLVRWSRLGFLAFAALLILTLGGWGIYVSKMEDKSRYSLAEDFSLNVMKELPKNSLLMADGDHYVMPIWYQQYTQGLRPDLIFQPSVFLYHNWGWAQFAERSADIQKAVCSSPLFVGRLTALTALAPQQPFYYSLERDYLQPVLDRVPGQWIPRGLAYEWRREAPDAREVLSRSASILNAERLRGLREFPDFKQIDPSTTQIYRYYALQHSLLAQFLNKLSLPKPKTSK